MIGVKSRRFVKSQGDTMIEKYRCYKGAWIYANDPHMESKLSKTEVDNLLSVGGLWFVIFMISTARKRRYSGM